MIVQFFGDVLLNAIHCATKTNNNQLFYLQMYPPSLHDILSHKAWKFLRRKQKIETLIIAIVRKIPLGYLWVNECNAACPWKYYESNAVAILFHLLMSHLSLIESFHSTIWHIILQIIWCTYHMMYKFCS